MSWYRWSNVTRNEPSASTSAAMRPSPHRRSTTTLEAEDMLYAIRLPANKVLQESIAHLLKRPRRQAAQGRAPVSCQLQLSGRNLGQAPPRRRQGRVASGVSCTRGSGSLSPTWAVPPSGWLRFYNQRGTAEQWIKEGKNAIRWTRLSCRRFDHNAVRLQLHALAYNLGNFMRTLALPDAVEQWSLTSLREKLIKIGAKIVRHGRYVTFQMAEVVIPRDLFADILRRILTGSDRRQPRHERRHPVPSRRRRQDRCARIAGKNAIPRHQRRQLVLNHPDRREDGRHSKANCTSRGFQPHSSGLGRFHLGNPG